MSQEMNFDEMRNQIAILRNKLDQQEIVNDRLIRSTMQTKVNKMNNNELRVIILGAFCIVLYPCMHYAIHISWALTFATIAMMLFTIIATILIHRPLHKADLMSDNLSTVSGIMARFKHQYDQWLHYVCPTIITPWLAWFCYEYTQITGLTGTARWCMIGFILLCGFIGFVIGYTMHRRTVNLAEDVMRQIGE